MKKELMSQKKKNKSVFYIRGDNRNNSFKDMESALRARANTLMATGKRGTYMVCVNPDSNADGAIGIFERRKKSFMTSQEFEDLQNDIDSDIDDINSKITGKGYSKKPNDRPDLTKKKT